jgi:hypothetical protein
MDSELLYTFFGIAGFVAVAYYTLRSRPKIDSQTKAKKKEEVVAEYRDKLQSVLDDLGEDQELRTASKKTLLKEFSDELSRNIFFDEDEVREIILELSKI